MPDKKLTDNEIVKALECMLGIHNQDIEFSIDCRGCAFDGDTLCCENCSDGIAKAALDLINRLQAENEELKSAINGFRGYEDKIKAEAYKEFAERVKLEFYYEFDELIPSIMADRIDNLLKELVGDNNVR